MQPSGQLLLLFFITTLAVLPKLSLGTGIRGNNVINANEKEFPFVVAIAERNVINSTNPNDILICTGTLITRFHVLTSQHCLDGEDMNNVQIRFGHVNLLKCQTYNIKSWKSYSEWYKETKKKEVANEEHDIAIITLATSIDGIKPALVSFVDGDELYGTNVRAVGWGQANHGNISEVLQTVKLHVKTNEQCKKQMFHLTKRRVYMPIRFFCTTAKPWALLGCGDSGGPLLDLKNRLVGINRGTCPNITGLDRAQEFLNQKQLNAHISLQYYERFIRDTIKIH